MATTCSERWPLTDAVDVCCPSVLAAPLGEADAVDLAAGVRRAGRPGPPAAAEPGRAGRRDLLLRPAGAARQGPADHSHHTKVLAEAGLIAGEKRGRWVWWRVVPERMAALRTALEVRA